MLFKPYFFFNIGANKFRYYEHCISFLGTIVAKLDFLFYQPEKIITIQKV
jgi:hypothetical protein